jgi:hypothetical protein
MIKHGTSLENHWKITGLRWFTGWWLVSTPLENDGVKVTWDDEIPNMMGNS